LLTDTQKPVILHGQEAHDDLRAMVEEHGEGLAGSSTASVAIFRKGSLWEARAEKCLPYRIPWEEMGFHISVAGPVTYKSAYRLRELARALPLERFLLETDSPFLSPMGVGMSRPM